MKYYSVILSCLVLLLTVRCFAQNQIQYMIPDAGAPGMSVQVDIFAPKSAAQAFGADRVASTDLAILLANPSDTSRVRIGPVVVRDNGRLLHTVFFVNPATIPGAVPIKVQYNHTISNADTFFVQLPDHIGTLSGGYATLGDGTPGHGKRSKRGTMIVDSLILNNGIYSFSSADCDASLFGDQGMLPVTVLVKTKFLLDNASELHLDANGANAAPGGGGGEANLVMPTCINPPAQFAGGAGYAGGNGNGNSQKTGIGSGVGGTALSGAASFSSGGPSFPFEDATAGGAGASGTVHIVSSDTTSGGGGGGGNGSAGVSGNSGSPLDGGNRLGGLDIVPFVGGGGGGSGAAYGQGCPASGVGGGGGGALSVFASQGIDVEGTVTANGADGGAASCNVSTSNAGGGGGGAAGSVAFSSYSSETFNGRVTLSPGNSGTACGIGLAGGEGGNGRLRIDGAESHAVTAQFVPSVFYHGPSVDGRSLSLLMQDTVRGYANGSDPIRMYLLNVNGYSQHLVGPFDTTASNGAFAFYIPADSLRKATSDSLVGIVVMQQITDLYTNAMTWTMGQSSGMIANLPHGTFTFDTSSVDFGEVDLGKSASVKVHLTNTGNSDLHIAQVKKHTTFFENVFSASGISVPFTLPIGKDTTFSLIYTPLDTGEIADSIIFSSNDLGTSAFYLGVKGYGVAPFILHDTAIDFGEKQINAVKRTRELTVLNTGNGTALLSQFRITGVNSTDFSVAVTGDTVSIAPGASRNVPISFNPLLDEMKTATLAFKANDTIGTYTVALSGEGVDSLIEHPAKICFAPNGSGDTMISICNGGEDTLFARAFRLEGNGGIHFGASPKTVIPPGECDSVEVIATLDSQMYAALFTAQFDSTSFSIDVMTHCDIASVNEVQQISNDLIQHYPEPFKDRATFIVASSMPYVYNSALIIYDMLGREVGKFPAAQLMGGNVMFEAGDLPAGVYYYRFTNGSRGASGEIVHLR